MDSGNSGSMQSSSGGDEEYDSRAESISTFLNSSGHQHPLQPPSHHHSSNPSSSLFDPLSSYLDAFSRSPPPPNVNSLLNLDMVWQRGIRSEPNCTDISRLTGQPNSGVQGSSTGRNPLPNPSFSSMMPLSQGPENGSRASSAPSDQTNLPVRNPKKRSRASRRAPTTVLTTDTSNFRAMVQEFTGIPAPPFSASPFPRSRLDLFNAASNMRSGHLDQAPPPYLLRPFAQKVQSPSFLSSPSFSTRTMADTIASTSNIVSTTNTTSIITTASTIAATTGIASNSTSTNNYQLPSDLGLNMQNPLFTFQSLLQSQPPKFSLANVPSYGTKTQGGSLAVPPGTDPILKMGLLEEFSMNHGHVNPNLTSLPSLVSSEGLSLRCENNPSSWEDGVGSNIGEQDHLRSFDGNYGNSQRVTRCKMNYPVASSDFHAEKGPDNIVSSRGEGIVDSWICSSD